MPYDPKLIANYFLELAWENGETLDPLKIQKLVYLAHGWTLALLGKPLIDEPVGAWRYGPVIKSLYKEFKEFGVSPILRKAKTPTPTSIIEQNTKNLLLTVWATYHKLSALQLSTLTHEIGYAWDLTRKSGDFSPWDSPVIPNDLIADEFNRRQQQKS